MRSHFCRQNVLTAACLTLAGCTPLADAANARRAARLVQVGATQLQETNTAYIGKPRYLAVDPADGSFYLADAFWDRVVRFDRSGGVLQTYGRRGDGPGEISQLGSVFLADSEVVAVDVRRRKLTRFRRHDATLLGETRFEGLLHTAHTTDGRVWLGVQNRTRATTVASWKTGGDSLDYYGQLSNDYLTSEPLSTLYSGIAVVGWSDTLLVGVMGMNSLTLMDTSGRVLRTIEPPVVRRRGSLPDAGTRFWEMTFLERFEAQSALFQMHRLKSGEVVLVHYDQRLTDATPQAWRGKVFVTLLSPDLASACPDAQLEISQDAQPHVAFRGDTLFVVEQRVDGNAGVSAVSAYIVDKAPCTWLPMVPEERRNTPS
jgi:hypothetical protein